jgi:hypothetical protein
MHGRLGGLRFSQSRRRLPSVLCKIAGCGQACDASGIIDPGHGSNSVRCSPADVESRAGRLRAGCSRERGRPSSVCSIKADDDYTAECRVAVKKWTALDSCCDIVRRRCENFSRAEIAWASKRVAAEGALGVRQRLRAPNVLSAACGSAQRRHGVPCRRLPLDEMGGRRFPASRTQPTLPPPATTAAS